MDELPEHWCACGKTRYATKREAQAKRNLRLQGQRKHVDFREGKLVVNRKLFRPGHRHRPGHLRVYECPEGKGWHLSMKRRWDG